MAVQPRIITVRRRERLFYSAILVSQPLRLMPARTPAWLAFAGWLTR